MEHLVRVRNERDRRALEWLRQQVGDAAVVTAVERCAGAGKPYLSVLCRYLQVRLPTFSIPRRRATSPAAEQSLAAIRSILAARNAKVGSGVAV